MSDPVLSIRGVHKAFGGLKVIDGVSFSLDPGSRTALIGPNGAGKTTLFNLISGVYRPDQGQIMLNGTDITAMAPRKRIRYGLARSFQNIRLMPHLSVFENVLLGQHVFGPMFGLVRAHRGQVEVEAALGKAGLAEFSAAVVSSLPYGIQKRVEVVRALVARPRLLLLDEPAAGLNSAETDALGSLLDRVARAGITLLVVEHDMHFVRRLCDRVVVLNFGCKIFEGSTDSVGQDAQVRAAYLGSLGGRAWGSARSTESGRQWV